MGEIHGRGVVVTEDRPSRFVYECEDSSGQWRWIMTLTPEEQGVRLNHRFERIHAPLWVLLTQTWLVYPLVGKAAVRIGLAKIKANVEGNMAVG